MAERQQFLARMLTELRGGLIVSCQAPPGDPLCDTDILARMAIAAWRGGAVGIRANGPDSIRAIRQAVPLPLIGLYKDGETGVYITPTIEHAHAVIAAGADIVALDGTQRPRPNGEQLATIIAAVHAEADKLVMADVSTLDEGLAAQAAGADFVSTTLSGYTPYSPQIEGPDLELVQALAARLRTPVIAEGRIRAPSDARAARRAGGFAVVVGAAITRPEWITAQFVDGLRR
ncbi:MAG: N-acetylmannosamine-6-phosphate 2-epimerase [Chloroflexales bacterium]|nr:N-acetylmannosamine-6-phosphate 2-epimerase [Chloroflexales bacterium]